MIPKSRRIAVAVLIVAAAIVAALAASGQPSSQEASFDSNLAEFLKRTDSSLLRIARLQDPPVVANAKQFEEYSLASSDPVLYQHFASVDMAHNRDSSASSDPKQANIQVIIPSSQTQKILQEIDPVLQGQGEYNVHSRNIEIGGKQYALEILIPK